MFDSYFWILSFGLRILFLDFCFYLKIVFEYIFGWILGFVARRAVGVVFKWLCESILYCIYFWGSSMLDFYLWVNCVGSFCRSSLLFDPVSEHGCWISSLDCNFDFWFVLDAVFVGGGSCALDLELWVVFVRSRCLGSCVFDF